MLSSPYIPTGDTVMHMQKSMSMAHLVLPPSPKDSHAKHV